MAEKQDVIIRRVRVKTIVAGKDNMEPIELEPQYSSNHTTGRCIRCLAEQYLKDCILDMLQSDKDLNELENKYNTLVTFLQSSAIEDLINETENLLASGKKVKLRLFWDNGEIKHEVIVKN